MTEKLPRRRCASGRACRPWSWTLGAVATVVLGLVLLGCGGPAGRRATGTSDQDGSTTRPDRLPPGSTDHTLDVDGTSRSFTTYVPADLDRSEPVPLVVMLHGGFGSSEQAERDYGWDDEAEREGFVVAYPNGEGRSWNAGSCCGGAARDGTDDVSFIDAVVADVGRRIPTDPRRTFVTGMSNGAMMALRMACETHTFAAVAPVAGAVMVPCDAASPISVLQIHGAADEHVPMDGSPGHGIGKVPAHTPVAESIGRWREIDRCGRPTESVEGVVTTSTSACEGDRAVTLVTIEGAGHQWPGASKRNERMKRIIGSDPPSDAMDATAAIWGFFDAHPSPA